LKLTFTLASQNHFEYFFANIHLNTTMTASPFTRTRQPLSTHNRRLRTGHSLSQDQPMKQHLASFVRKNVSEEEIITEEIACEQSSNENIFRQPSQAEDSNSEMEEMWTLKRANPIFSMLDEDDEEDEAELYASPSKRQRTQMLSMADQVSGESSISFLFSADSSRVN
jgi:hypothetical protein